MRMELLDLPPEVLHIILFNSALNRHVKRALRLRLVCKTFAVAVYPALFETRLMDQFNRVPIGTLEWQLWNQHGAEKVWHEYLVMRIMAEKSAAVGRYCEIRQIAEIAHEEMQYMGVSSEDSSPTLELRNVVEELCWLLLRQGVNEDVVNDLYKWGPMKPKRPTTAEFNLSLLSAAAHLDLPSLAQRLLDDGCKPTDHDFLFVPAMQAAAQAGSIAILRLFQKQLPDGELGVQRWAAVGAAIRGDLANLKMALDLQLRNLHNHLDLTKRAGDEIARGRPYSSIPEIYDHFHSIVAGVQANLDDVEGSTEQSRYEDLINYAQLGNVEMVKHLLDLGLPVQKSERKSPLVAACKGGHLDVVQLLLERGANTSSSFGWGWPAFPLHESTTAGSLAIAKLLLDHGAQPNREAWHSGWYPAIWWAFSRESPAMVRLLIERGASVNERLGKSIADMLHNLGCESMEELLWRTCGYIVDDGTPYPVGRRGMGWHRWPEAQAIRARLLELSEVDGI